MTCAKGLPVSTARTAAKTCSSPSPATAGACAHRATRAEPKARLALSPTKGNGAWRSGNRALLTGAHVAQDVCAPVPHRQFVFTMPRNLRTYFRRDRHLLAALPRLAWDSVREVYAAVLGRTDRLPGMVAVPQTFGELAHWNPHVHALVTDGAFTADGTFVPVPETAAADFAGVWREKVFALLRDAGCINGRVVFLMRRWTHTGFSVDRSVRIHGSDHPAVERIVQYMARCPFSLERIVRVTPEGQVVYRTENGQCRPFVFEGRADAAARTVARNSQVFTPLDFLAACPP